MQFVQESLDEHLNEGKLTKALAIGVAGLALALSPMKAHGQTNPEVEKASTEIQKGNEVSKTPMMKSTKEVSLIDKDHYTLFSITVQVKGDRTKFAGSGFDKTKNNEHEAKVLAVYEAIAQLGLERSDVQEAQVKADLTKGYERDGLYWANSEQTVAAYDYNVVVGILK